MTGAFGFSTSSLSEYRLVLAQLVMDSSRIFIRGLPPNVTVVDFQRHFSTQSDITDARLIPHRRIGYVGYKTPEDAIKAVKYHDKTFINMSRIRVELARSVRHALVQLSSCD